MNEEELINAWKQNGQVVVNRSNLITTLVLLSEREERSVIVKQLGDDKWGIAKIY
jgi:hypothetical protein